jgi:hypothetical protein
LKRSRSVLLFLRPRENANLKVGVPAEIAREILP